MRRKFRVRDWNDPNWETNMKEYQERRNRNRAFFGIAVAIIGAVWIFSLAFHFNFDLEDHWPFVLIIIGVLIGIKNNFRNSAWWILIIIGGANVVENYFYNYSEYVWPAALVLGGIALALTKRKNYCGANFKMDNSISAESTLSMDITFGGRKEMITSKEFKSGNISVTFGGCELNFMQADISDSPAIIDLKVSFGGVEIIVPSHWQIQNEISPSFGNVEDERVIQTATTTDNKKVLILRGNCSFGNVEIKSY
jgi:predicted membrane protein